MPMNIEPTLKAKIDSAVKIARATFAKDCPEEELIATCLRTYIDRGLARVEFDSKGSSTALETELLKNAAPVLLDLSKLQFDASKEKNHLQWSARSRLFWKRFSNASKPKILRRQKN